MNRNDLPEPNATCEVCGHKYRICQKCAQMRLRGIEAWRQHCDSYECAMYYYLVSKDHKDITEDEFNNVMGIELPDGRQLTKEMQNKLDGIENYLSEQKNSMKKKNDDEMKGLYKRDNVK